VLHKFLFSCLIASLAVVVVAFAPAALASNPVTYSANDTSPDAAGAPDITSVVVSDSTQGLITFQINFAPGTDQPSQDSYNVYVDADQNPTTGDPSGAGTDYLLQYDGTPGGGLGFYKWDGKSAYQFVSTSSLTGNFTGDSQYFVIAASDMGITDGFNFNVAAAIGSDPSTSSQVDFVPENGTNFHYSIQSKPTITLRLADWEDTSTAHAGKGFATAIIVTRSDSAAAVVGGATVTCTLTVRGRRVAAVTHGFTKVPWYKGGPKKAAVCTWRLPANSAGATLVAKETVTLGSATASKAFTARIHK